MNTENHSKLIALVGGSGAGKSWLAKQLCEELGGDATSISLDDFYADLSHLMLSERERINFDHPEAIDWPLFENVLRELRAGRTVTLPRYDFATHNRLPSGEVGVPTRWIIVEGLWLLWSEPIRELFDLRVFLDCSAPLRWNRRLKRDLEERHRTTDTICDQFWNVVAPMHERFVESQKPWADLVIAQPTSGSDFGTLISAIRALGTASDSNFLETVPEISTLQTL